MSLEDKARVVIEIAAKAGGEAQTRHVDAARRDEAKPLVEGIEGRVNVEPGVAGECAQRRRTGVGLAGDGEEGFERRALLLWHAGDGVHGGLLQKAIGDFARRAAAHR